LESLSTDPDIARALDGLPTGPRRTKLRGDGAALARAPDLREYRGPIGEAK
jgi:hypothetical protein